MAVIEYEQTQIERVIAETIVAEPETPSFNDGIDPRVQKGVLWLDENIPGWADRIDLYTFNIRYNDRCVLGQLEGKFYDGVAKWFGRDSHMQARLDVAGEHGFLWKRWQEHASNPDSDLLQDSWVRVINARQIDFNCAG